MASLVHHYNFISLFVYSYLCPGNERASGEANPKYATTYTFENDYAALLPDEMQEPLEEDLEKELGMDIH